MPAAAAAGAFEQIGALVLVTASGPASGQDEALQFCRRPRGPGGDLTARRGGPKGSPESRAERGPGGAGSGSLGCACGRESPQEPACGCWLQSSAGGGQRGGHVDPGRSALDAQYRPTPPRLKGPHSGDDPEATFLPTARPGSGRQQRRQQTGGGGSYFNRQQIEATPLPSAPARC